MHLPSPVLESLWRFYIYLMAFLVVTGVLGCWMSYGALPELTQVLELMGPSYDPSADEYRSLQSAIYLVVWPLNWGLPMLFVGFVGSWLGVAARQLYYRRLAHAKEAAAV